MPPYSYSKLDHQKREIRLLTLLPGEFDDPIELIISHVPFTPTTTRRSKRIFPQQLLDSLPSGWSVLQTMEDRVLYDYTSDSTTFTQWTHPDPNFQFNDLEQAPVYDSPNSGIISYEALSYTWGAPDSLKIASVVEFSAAALPFQKALGTLDIRHNLACALQHLRYQTKGRVMWVDAICINQKDLDEREAQVLRMSSIYTTADRVLVWFGPKLVNSRLALTTLTHLGKQLELTWDNAVAVSPECKKSDWYMPEKELDYEDETWLALRDLVSNTWFDRLWVLQEIQLASPRSSMIWGEDEISWPLFRRGIVALWWYGNFGNHSPLPFKLFERLTSLPELCCNKLQRPLPFFLNTVPALQCAEAVDKIFGILGLTPSTFTATVVPDYHQSAREVYQSTFLHHINLVHRLELFALCNLDVRPEGWPSWVPNWSKTQSASMNHVLGKSASGNSSTHTKYQPLNTLELLGVQVSTISSVHMSLQSESDITSILGLQNVINDFYPTGEPLMVAYAKTLTLNTLRERVPWEHTMAHWELEEVTQMLSAIAAKTGEGETNPQAESLCTSIFKYNRGQRFVFTEKGYFGFGPNLSQEGDIVCVFLGCDHPMLLRPSGDTAFEVVGVCHLYGIMDGEAILGPLPSTHIVRPRFINDTWEPTYWNSVLNTVSDEDPRLEKLSEEWEKVTREKTADDPLLFAPHRNVKTGEVINSDPRMLPEMLRRRGVRLEWFKLI